jgi:hypothetical protein
MLFPFEAQTRGKVVANDLYTPSVGFKSVLWSSAIATLIHSGVIHSVPKMFLGESSTATVAIFITPNLCKVVVLLLTMASVVYSDWNAICHAWTSFRSSGQKKVAKPASKRASKASDEEPIVLAEEKTSAETTARVRRAPRKRS